MIIEFKIFENKKEVYYRAESKYLGEEYLFKQEQGDYYEYISDNDQPEFIFDEWKLSDTQEVAASKTIGGAVMGAFSIRKTKEYYIYKINENPDKDISHWSGGDFDYIDEVRYRRDVKGDYIGKVTLSNYEYNLLKAFYLSYQTYYSDIDEEDEIFLRKFIDDFENIPKILKNIKPNNKILEKKEINFEIENNDQEITQEIIDKFSLIVYKQKRNPRNIRIRSIEGYYNKQNYRNKNILNETKIIITLSNYDIIEGRLFIYNDRNNILVKINGDILYNLDNENFNINSLIDKMFKIYQKYIEKRNWNIK